jgi:hypothetical protein
LLFAGVCDEDQGASLASACWDCASLDDVRLVPRSNFRRRGLLVVDRAEAFGLPVADLAFGET